MDMAYLKEVLMFLLCTYGVPFYERLYDQIKNPKMVFVLLCITISYFVLNA